MELIWRHPTIRAIGVPQTPIQVGDVDIIARIVCEGNPEKPGCLKEHEGFAALEMLTDEGQGTWVEEAIYNDPVGSSLGEQGLPRLVVASALNKIPLWRCWGMVEVYRSAEHVEIVVFNKRLLERESLVPQLQTFLRNIVATYSLPGPEQLVNVPLEQLLASTRAQKLKPAPVSQQVEVSKTRLARLLNQRDTAEAAVEVEISLDISVRRRTMGTFNDFITGAPGCPVTSLADFAEGVHEACEGNIAVNSAASSLSIAFSTRKVNAVWRSRAHRAFDLRLPDDPEMCRFWKNRFDEMTGTDPSTPVMPFEQACTKQPHFFGNPKQKPDEAGEASSAPIPEPSTAPLLPVSGNNDAHMTIEAFSAVFPNKEMASALIEFNLERLVPALQKVREASLVPPSARTYRSHLEDIFGVATEPAGGAS